VPDQNPTFRISNKNLLIMFFDVFFNYLQTKKTIAIKPEVSKS